MKMTAITSSIVLILILIGSTLCYGGSFVSGITNDFYGGIKLVDSAICFADGSCQTSAVFTDGSAIWGQIEGMIDNQIDLSTKFLTKEDKVNKGIANGYAPLDGQSKVPLANLPTLSTYLAPTTKTFTTVGYTPTWENNGSTWKVLTFNSLPVDLAFTPSGDNKYLTVSYTDNVGISGPVWCNLGIFKDEELTPFCYGSWSGTSFQQVKLSCTIQSSTLTTYTIKHRSGMCLYGNYWLDDFATMRSLTVQEH